MKVEKAFFMESDPEAVWVALRFYPSEDERRHTVFYKCEDRKKAEWLVEALNLAAK